MRMSDDNSQNLLYFEAASMRTLYDTMETWQQEKQKRLLSLNVHRDGDLYCCIALTNPTEVVIVDRAGSDSAGLYQGKLVVWNLGPR